jgi:hypothetical protein
MGGSLEIEDRKDFQLWMTKLKLRAVVGEGTYEVRSSDTLSN